MLSSGVSGMILNNGHFFQKQVTLNPIARSTFKHFVFKKIFFKIFTYESSMMMIVILSQPLNIIVFFLHFVSKMFN